MTCNIQFPMLLESIIIIQIATQYLNRKIEHTQSKREWWRGPQVNIYFRNFSEKVRAHCLGCYRDVPTMSQTKLSRPGNL